MSKEHLVAVIDDDEPFRTALVDLRLLGGTTREGLPPLKNLSQTIGKVGATASSPTFTCRA